jgi:HEAT repeat protein
MRFAPELIEMLFDMLERDARAEELELFADAFLQVIDALVLAGDFSRALLVLSRVKESAGWGSEGRRAMFQKLGDMLSAQMIERHRLDAFLQHLGLSHQVDLAGASEYLMLCGSDQIPLLLEHLPRIERPDRKSLVIDTLVDAGRGDPDIFVTRLRESAPSLARDMLSILQHIDPKESTKLIAPCLAHENAMIRLEALRMLAMSEDAEALGLLEAALVDPSVQVRMTAYRTLAAHHPKAAMEKLSALITGDGYVSLEERERIAIAIALGETRLPAALRLLAELLKRKRTLLNRQRSLEQKRMAVVGLEAMRTVEAFKVLNRELQNKEQGIEIQQACRDAALRIKNRLERAA